MNNIYKVIWSKAKNCYVVASEIARSHTKSATGSEKIGGVTRRSLLASLMALSLLCGGLGVASAANSTVHVDESASASGAAEVYTKTGVDTLLADYGRKTEVETNKNNIANLQTTTIDQGQKIATNTADIANNKTAIDKKIDTVTADARYAAKADLIAKADATALDDKADKTAVAALEGRVGNLETTVGDTSSGLVKDVNDLNTSIGAKANQSDLVAATNRITANEGNITELQRKTTNIDYDVANQTTSINGMKVGQQVDMGGKDITNARALTATGKVTGDGVDAGTGAITGGSLTVTGKVTGNGVDAGAGDITTTGNVKGGTLETTGNASIGGALTATGKVTGDGVDAGTGAITGGSLTVTGKVTGNGVDAGAGDITTTGNVKGGTLETTGNASIGGALTATGKVTGDGVDAGTGAITGGSLTVTGKVTGNGVDAGAGDITTTGNVKGGTLETTGNATIGGALTATGKVTGDGVDAGTGAITGGSLTVTGKVTGNGVDAGAGDITTTGNVKGGTLETTGNATIGGALSATGKVTGNGVDAGTGDITGGSLTVTGKVTGNGVDAGAGDITTTGNVKGGTLETTGDATIGRNLDVKGTLNTKDVTAETIRISKSENNPDYKSEGSIIGEGGKLSVSNEKFDKRTNITEKSELNVNEKGTVNWATSTDATGNKTEGHSEVTADNIKNFVKKTEGGKTFGYEENITADGKVGTVTDKEGNTSSTRQDSKGIYGYAKDKDGNKSYTKQEGNRIAESVIGQDGKQTKSEMTSTDITNTAKDGTITNTAKNVTNEGTESVTNKVGANEVKVSTNGVDITAEAGKKITESVGTASRVVENDKITDNAGDSTVTTEKDKGTTFGKAGSTGTTNIYGDSIRTGTINAEDTTTGKLTAGAAAGADGGRLTVDANDGVKGSYKYGDYTSRSYILANTLQSGVDNGKDITDNGFVGSRTDHYMDGDKAKLNETVKDADGSNVTKKTSTKTYTEIKDTNGNTLSVNQKADGNNYKLEDQDGNTNHVTNSATQSKQTLKDKDGNTLTTNQTATKNNFDLKSADGSKENHTTNTVDESRVAIKGENGKAELSTTDEGTTFKHSAAKEAFTEGGATNTTIKGNTITTGKVTMDYADVMKDLGVYGNTTLGEAGKDTTLTVNSKATFNEIATFENGAEVKNGLTVSSGGLNVTGESTFNDKVNMKNGLDVTGGVASDSFTVKGTDIKIDSSGINAGGTVISNVADGSISEGSKDAVNGGQLYQVKNDLEGKVNKVGANAAAMANLHPMEFDPDSKWNIAAAIGNYGSETAAALGAFYRPNDDVMVNLSTAFGTGENMVGGGVSVRLGKGGNKLSREETNALKAQVADLTARMDALLSVLNPNMSKDFPDVPENHWAYEAVSRLAGNDIVQGYPDGEFHGERTMTRYEMAEIIYNALSRGAEAEKELVEEFKPELQAMAASEKATAEG